MPTSILVEFDALVRSIERRYGRTRKKALAANPEEFKTRIGETMLYGDVEDRIKAEGYRGDMVSKETCLFTRQHVMKGWKAHIGNRRNVPEMSDIEAAFGSIQVWDLKVDEAPQLPDAAPVLKFAKPYGPSRRESLAGTGLRVASPFTEYCLIISDRHRTCAYNTTRTNSRIVLTDDDRRKMTKILLRAIKSDLFPLPSEEAVYSDYRDEVHAARTKYGTIRTFKELQALIPPSVDAALPDERGLIKAHLGTFEKGRITEPAINDFEVEPERRLAAVIHDMTPSAVYDGNLERFESRVDPVISWNYLDDDDRTVFTLCAPWEKVFKRAVEKSLEVQQGQKISYEEDLAKGYVYYDWPDDDPSKERYWVARLQYEPPAKGNYLNTALGQEGDAQGHCFGGTNYQNDLKNGEIAVFSLRREVANANVEGGIKAQRIYSLHAEPGDRPDEGVEVRGKANNIPGFKVADEEHIGAGKVALDPKQAESVARLCEFLYDAGISPPPQLEPALEVLVPDPKRVESQDRLKKYVEGLRRHGRVRSNPGPSPSDYARVLRNVRSLMAEPAFRRR